MEILQSLIRFCVWTAHILRRTPHPGPSLGPSLVPLSGPPLSPCWALPSVLVGLSLSTLVGRPLGHLLGTALSSCCALPLLAVRGRLKKSNYFLERVHVPDRSGIRSCLGEREASLPQTATQSHGFASQPGGASTPMPRTQNHGFASQPRGHAPPCPGHKVQVRHTQDPHYANLRFYVSGEGGHAPHPTRRKTTVLHRQLRFWT